MFRPFFLSGTTITLYRYSLSFLDSEGNSKTSYFFNMAALEYEKSMLQENGCTGFVTAELDTSTVEWLEGINVDEGESMEQAVAIWQMGETAYWQMINAPTTDEYLVDLDYRLSKIELGI